MPTPRQRRVATALMFKLSELLHLEARDPRLEGITVTEVEVDRELQYAVIYVNALGDETRQAEVLDALGSAAGFLRHRLSESLDFRKVPELRFEWDSAFENASRIDALLDSLDLPQDPQEDSGPD